MGQDIIYKYFPELTALQRSRIERLEVLYTEWNTRINVISRKDMDSFYLRHVLHSLAIAKACRFEPGARVLDAGCGGGFPGIPLAIMFPDVRFTLADSIAKKIKVVQEVVLALELTNVEPVNARVESLSGSFDYVVSRAVTQMPEFAGWTWNKIEAGRRGTLPSGILYLKGGDLKEELDKVGKYYEIYPVQEWFEEDFFETKSVVYLPKI